jgi:putative ABC transport system substrate-binding protein
MRRREFIGLVGSAMATFPLAARAQRGGMRTVGVLLSGIEGDPDSKARIAAFQKGMAELGWKEGDNLRVEYRWGAGKRELISQYAAELVALKPDVILANSTTVVATLKSLTTSIPVVIALVIDPVGMGYVESLPHPGGNFTGFTFISPELIGKWTDLLKDMTPAVTRAALLFNPATSPFYTGFVQEIEATRKAGEIEVVTIQVASVAEMEAGIAALAKQPASSLLIGPDPFTLVNLKQIAQLALQNRLPAISVYRPFTTEGGLMAYGPDTAEIFRRAAGYVDRILKGAKPAELPVQQPDKFEFTINLKTAKALGVTIAPTLLATADEVIE